jgi:hypothetical protein
MNSSFEYSIKTYKNNMFSFCKFILMFIKEKQYNEIVEKKIILILLLIVSCHDNS